MKANELRLGNWVSSKLHKGLETEIFAIRSSEVIGLGSNPMANYKLKDIKPIKITKEWLLKLGFEKRKSDWFYIEFKMSIFDTIYEYNFLYNMDSCLVNTDWRKNNEENYEFEKHIAVVNYVHQLQNLYFALTNTELCLNDQIQ